MRHPLAALHSFVFLGLAAAMLAASPRLAAAGPGGAEVRTLAPQLDGTINVNDASLAQLELLPGIGPATATKIVAYRSRRPFRHISHVMRVKGIGRKTYNAIKPYLTTTGETTLRVVGQRGTVR